MRRFGGDVGGSTAIEYAMIAGLISIFVVGAISLVGQTMQDVFYTKLGQLFQ